MWIYIFFGGIIEDKEQFWLDIEKRQIFFIFKTIIYVAYFLLFYVIIFKFVCWWSTYRASYLLFYAIVELSSSQDNVLNWPASPPFNECLYDQAWQIDEPAPANADAGELQSHTRRVGSV